MSQPTNQNPRTEILIEREPPIGWLVVNRPDKLNAFNLALWKSLPGELAKLESDPKVRVIVFRGAGERAFGAGADITEFEENRRDPDTAADYAESNERAFEAIRGCSKPTVAMIHGFCVGGGCAVALCADIRVAADDAKFALTPARLGLGYSFSGVRHAVAELGPAAARYIFLTARQIDANKAAELGIVQEVWPKAELEARTRDLAGSIAENAPKTLRALKLSIREAIGAGNGNPSARVEELIRACFESEDYREGLRAFGEKRKPSFQDK